jgi:hypothetical protein
MSVESHGGMILAGEVSWPVGQCFLEIYQQSQLVASQEEHSEKMWILSTKYLFSYS